MADTDLWQSFESTGSVSEYLRYKNSQRAAGGQKKAGESRADGYDRNSAARSESGRSRPDINDPDP